MRRSGSPPSSACPAGIPVAAGAGDAAAGAIGIGAIADGDAFVSLGTSAQYFVTTAAYRPYPGAAAPGLLPRPAGSAGTSARRCSMAPAAWAGQQACSASPTSRPWWRGSRRAGRGPSRVLFLPYLAGERTPHDDPNARGVLFGLDADTDAIEVAQAVMEGVAFSLAEAQDCLAAAGTEVTALAAIGGGARSPFWMRLLATVLDRPVTLYAGAAKGPAFGAARLARLALTGEAPEAVCGKPQVAEVLEPEPALVGAYNARAGASAPSIARCARSSRRPPRDGPVHQSWEFSFGATKQSRSQNAAFRAASLNRSCSPTDEVEELPRRDDLYSLVSPQGKQVLAVAGHEILGLGRNRCRYHHVVLRISGDGL